MPCRENRSLIDPAQKVYVDAVRDFLQTKGIKQARVKIENILRVDLGGDGEEEVLINVMNYLQKDESVPMKSPAGSYSMVLLRRVISGKGANAACRKRILSKGNRL
jgi:hypothetical protein